MFYLISCFLCFSWTLNLSYPYNVQAQNSINTNSHRFSVLQAYEYVFVHTDKQLYVTGETIWMSLYCLEANSYILSDISAIAYLELLNNDASPIFQTKIKLSNGRGSANFFIDPSIPSGVYHIKAYTNWMKNGNPEAFFELSIPIVNPSIPPVLSQNSNVNNTQTQTLKPTSSSQKTDRISLSKEVYRNREKVQLTFEIGESAASLSVSVYKIQPELLNEAFENEYSFEIPSFIEDIERVKPFENQLSALLYPPEMRAPTIRGQIKGIIPSNLNLSFAGTASELYSVPTMPNGQFHIEVSPSIPQKEMLFWTNGENISESLISIESPFVSHTITNKTHHFPSEEWKTLIESFSSNAQINHLYDTHSHIRGLPPDTEPPIQFYGKPQIVYKLDDYTRFPNLDDVFLEYINKARKKSIDNKNYLHVWDEYRNIFSISNSYAFDTAALILIDGIPILDPDFFWNFNVLKIERIDIVPKRYFAADQMYSGIVHFRTYKHDFGGQTLPNYLVRKTYHPIQIPWTFYSPNYSLSSNKRIPDFRTTLYWNPIWKINSLNLHSLSFFTGDDIGWYKVEIHGITDAGTPIYATNCFEVRADEKSNR